MRFGLRLFLAVLLCLAPVAAEKPPLKTILDYKTELVLSAAQVQHIQQQLSTFRNQLLQTRSQERPLQAEVSKLISEDAPLPQIRERLTRLAELQVESRLNDVVIARSISGILSKQQLQQWKSIQAREKARRKPPT